MKIEKFVGSNISWGRPLKKVGDYYFCSHRDSVFPFPVFGTFPLNQKVRIDPELVRLLKRRFLITQVLLDLPKKDIYEFVLTTDNYNLELFKGKCRKSIRNCLEICNFRKPSQEDLLNEGFVINRQLSKRESLADEKLTNYEHWVQYVNSIYNAKGFTLLGAYKENRMIGYITVFELNGKFNTVEAYFDRNHASGISPMRGLLYILVNNLIRDHGKITISYGFHRYLRTTNLTRFKESMHFKRFGFAKGYVVNPLMLFCLRLIVFIMLKLLKRRNFKRKWARATIRLYQGHRRLIEALKQHQLTDQSYETFRPQQLPDEVLLRTVRQRF